MKKTRMLINFLVGHHLDLIQDENGLKKLFEENNIDFDLYLDER